MFAELAIGDEQDDVEQGHQDHDDAGDAVDNAANGEEAFEGEQRAGPDLIGVFEGEAGPDEDDKRHGEQSVLEPLPGVHAELADGESGLWLNGARLQAQGAELTDPVTAIVEQHKADGERDDEEIEEARVEGLPGLGAAFGDVDGADGETGTGAGVAVAAGLGQVLCMDGGFGIGRGQHLMEAVAGGAVGYGLGAGFGGETVEGVAEGGDTVRGETEAAGEAEIAVAAAAGFTNGGRADGGAGGFGAEDGVFAVAIGTNGCFGDAGGEGFAVDTGLVVGEGLGVAKAAEFGDIFVKRGGFGGLGFVGFVVADGAVRGGGIAGTDLFAVNGTLMFADLSGVAGVAVRLGEFFGVRVFAMLGVALGTGDFGVGGGGEDLGLILVTGEAIDRSGRLREGERGTEQEQAEEAKATDSGAAGGHPFLAAFLAERHPEVTTAGGVKVKRSDVWDFHFGLPSRQSIHRLKSF